MDLLIPNDGEQTVEIPGQMTFVPEPAAPPSHKSKFDAEIRSEAALNDPSMIRILLCDVLAKFDGRLPEDWLYEIAVGAGHISYFLYEDALGWLLDSGSVVTEPDTAGQPQCYLTERGRLTVRRLRRYVPKLFRDQVMLTALRYVSRQKALRDLKIRYESDADGWHLCLTCSDQGREMFFLRIAAPDRAAAEMLGERILRNPAGFFGKVIDLAVRNEEEQFDLTDN
ncbi:MAG: DUF4364 family protein [Oscillospiraceae bacterium]|nr:DUF4364 family protein [Oscillospiraceae bacterium]